MNTASEQCVVSKAVLRAGSSSMSLSTAVAESSTSLSDADEVAVEAWETIKIAEDVPLAKSCADEPTQSVQQPDEAPRASSCEYRSGSWTATRSHATTCRASGPDKHVGSPGAVLACLFGRAVAVQPGGQRSGMLCVRAPCPDADGSSDSFGCLATGPSSTRMDRCQVPLCPGMWILASCGNIRLISIHIHRFLGVYSALLLAATVSDFASRAMHMSGSLRACAVIHRKLMDSVLGTTLR